MSSPDFLGRGWAFPITTQAGKISFAADDRDIAQAIIIIICTAKGQRVMLPDFGCEINEILFAPNNQTTLNLASLYVRQSIEQWEPRVHVQKVIATIDENNRNYILIEVDYIILSKNLPTNLVYPYYLKK